MRAATFSTLSNRSGERQGAARRAFTLIELILVMTILTIAVSITAPALVNFFRGRALDSEARRLLSLTRAAQSRAASEGIPMDLWIDDKQGAYGMSAEASYEPSDSKAVNFTLEGDIKIEATGPSTANTPAVAAAVEATPANSSDRRANLPRIRFLPDGSASETSPQTIRLTGRDGLSLWLVLSRDGANYELRNTPN